MDVAAEYVHEELLKVGGNPLQLRSVLRPVAFLYTVQAMIDNGGFRYIFEGDFPFSPPYSAFVEAYREIGADGAAIRLERAVALFPFKNPHLAQEQRNDFMDSLDESYELFQLGNEVCGDETVWACLEQYVKKHRDDFRAT